MGRITRPLRRSAMGKFPALNNLVEHWPDIATPDIARHAVPIKLIPQRTPNSSGEKNRPCFTLHLQVKPAFAPLLQHDLPGLQTRCNQFLGYDAISKITLHQAPPEPYQRPALRPITPVEQKNLDAMGAKISDPVLRDALTRLGMAILRQKR